MSVKKWEYLVETIFNEFSLEALLDRRGAEGWELTTLLRVRDQSSGTRLRVVFKREKNPVSP